MLSDRYLEVSIDDPGLHPTQPIRGVDLENLIHAVQREHHTSVDRIGCSCQTSTGSSGHDRHVGHIRCLDRGHDLCGRSRHDQNRRGAGRLEHRPVLAVGLDHIAINLNRFRWKPLL